MLCPKCGKEVGEVTEVCKDCQESTPLQEHVPPSDKPADLEPEQQNSNAIDNSREKSLKNFLLFISILLVLIIGLVFIIYKLIGNNYSSIEDLWKPSSSSIVKNIPRQKYVSKANITTTTIPRPKRHSITKGSLGFISSDTHEINFQDAIAIYNAKYNYIEIGFFENKLSQKQHAKIRKYGRLEVLKERGPNFSILINFSNKNKTISNQNIQNLTTNIYKRNHSHFTFKATSPVLSFRKDKSEFLGDLLIQIEGTLYGESPSISIKTSDNRQHIQTRENFSWNIDCDVTIIKKKRRQALRVKSQSIEE